MDIASLFDPAISDPETLVMRAALASGVAGVVVMLGLGRLVRGDRRTAVAWTFGVSLAFAAGIAALGARPVWPPLTVFDRFLVFIAAAAITIETLAIWIGQWAWLPRIALASGIVPILLYGSIVTSDAAGPGTRQWPPIETAEYFVLFGEAIVAGWFAISFLQDRIKCRSLPVALAIACGGGGVVVMFSGYLTGGQVGIALGGALMGAAIASLLVAGPHDARGAVGIAFVGFVSMLVAGRYFGSLTTMHALLLFAAPFACWLPEFLPTKVWIRGALGVLLTAAQVGHVAYQAKSAAEPPAAAESDEGNWYK